MKADSKKIEWLLENASQYSIAKGTGITQSKLSYLLKGIKEPSHPKAIKIENLSLEIASKLTNFSEEIQKISKTLDIISKIRYNEYIK
ncbi:XRE family transcriptional regulator [Streptococcus dysgalactiae]|uniref:XRE family transcriptional regulator n=1 Tax=Streptococcus dysgalactiae TaxID=1334 RepID=UPI0010F0730B|nr:XRE family transcriptional regulator [Streptococcus dysgalactiae]VTT15828.1 Uncharacterised protein [Streptococcus dysgalactiae]